MPHSITVREALQQATRYYRIALDTGNRELRVNCKEFIRNHWHMRNSNKVILVSR